MGLMTEEQFGHLEAMIKAVVDAHIKANMVSRYEQSIELRTNEAIMAATIEHEVRKKAKEAFTI